MADTKADGKYEGPLGNASVGKQMPAPDANTKKNVLPVTVTSTGSGPKPSA